MTLDEQKAGGPAPYAVGVSAPLLSSPELSASRGAGLRSWSRRRWAAAAVAAVGTALLIGLPTDVIPNPVFGRPVPVTWWSLPVLLVTSVLSGLLLATYVREPDPAPANTAAGNTAAGDSAPVELGELDRTARVGGVGGLLAFFAVGCPVCNKLVLLALGTTGAMELFAPVQPILAVGSVLVLAIALRARLRSASTCTVPA